MNPRTRSALVGLGFDTDLIDAVDKNKHTVDALRALGKKALLSVYTPEQVGVIQAKIVRQPIPDDVVARVLTTAGEACCFCADGNSARPYQIHHITPYAATQDHSEDNLLVVCPTHHVVIHDQKIPADEQRHRRRQWHALVEVANWYKAKDIGFPFGSFVALDFSGPGDPTELIRQFRVSPRTALAISDHTLAHEVRDVARRDRLAVLIGVSGDGKTTLAEGVAGLLAREGRRAFRYRPPSNDNRLALKEILEFLAVAVCPSVIVLDDVNTWATATELEDISRAVSDRAEVIATWTRDRGGDDTRVEHHFSGWIRTEWSRLRPVVRDYLLRHEVEVVSALREFEDERDVRRVGIGMFGEDLDTRMRRFEREAKTVSEFLFLLRGGEEVVRKELSDLFDRDRADIPVLYAAVEQIADFERPVTVEECAGAIKQVGSAQGLPEATPSWIRSVFEQERSRRRMQRRRDAYTTIHRDWARRLICSALGDDRTRDAISALLARDFDPRTPRPRRTMILWSWLWYDAHGTPFVNQWAAGLTEAEWSMFVGTAAADLGDVGLVADRLHILFPGSRWDETLSKAFTAHTDALAARVSGAGPESWWALKVLFNLMSRVCPDAARKVLECWPAATAAAVFEQTHPDYFNSAWWFFSSASKVSHEWCAEVGHHLSWDRVKLNLLRTRVGDINAIELCQSILGRLGVKLLRSRLSQYAGLLRDTLSGAPLSEIQVGFGYDLRLVLQFFPDELKRIAAAVEPVRFAAELSIAPPRDWRTPLELVELIRPGISEVPMQIVGNLLPDRFVETVRRYGSLCPYELRCLLWFVSHGPQDRRSEIALHIRDVVKDACIASEEEKPRLLEAYSNIDEALAIQLAADLGFSGPLAAKRDDRELRLSDRESKLADAAERIRLLDANGDDYDVGELFRPAGEQNEVAEAHSNPGPAAE